MRNYRLLDEENQDQVDNPEYNLDLQSSYDPQVLETLAQVNPDLIQKYKAQIAQKNQAIEDAKRSKDMVTYANVAGNVLNDLSNSQKRDVILKNRKQELGRAPNVVQTERSKWDNNSLDNLANSQVKQAYSDRDFVDKNFQDEFSIREMESKQNQALKMNDPNSTESKSAREYLIQLVPSAKNYPNYNNMTAAQVEKIAPALYKKWYDTQKLNAESNKLNTPNISDELSLSKSYRDHPVTKATNEVATSYEKIKRASADATGASDMSLVFSYMKMMDPGSTVREGEYANAANTTGIPERVLNIYNKAKDGSFLNPAQRADFVNQANKIYEAQISRQKQIHKEFSDTAAGYGMNSRRAFGQQPTETVSYPKNVFKDGNMATVNDENEMREAQKEGWK